MEKTDWDQYYQQPYKTSGFLKTIVTRRLLKYIKKYAVPASGFTMLEYGGGNSCFYELFMRTFSPACYCIIDNNQVGLDRFSRRIGPRNDTLLLNRDILDLAREASPDLQYDVVFSIGLIEHFSVEGTREAVRAHFNVLKPGGLLILGFPTPTLLYRITRRCSQMLGLWMFHDERPLKIPEVMETAAQQGELLEQTIIRPIFLTQAMLMIRKAEK